MRSGELIVTGKNSIKIPIERFPSEVRCYFKDEFEVLPCNAGDVDFLEYDVHTSNTHLTGFILVIRWSVSGAREIKWQVSY